MTPALLVLGAGEEQVVLYREARRRGLPTIAVDMRADRPGIALADRFLKLSTTDHEAIAEALVGQEIAGVVSTAADTCLESWHRLSEHFATPWRYPASAAAVSMDKSAFHALAASVGVPVYQWAQSHDLADLATSASGFGLPVVVKPTDASGCRGVLRVDEPSELDAALHNAAVNSPSGQVIVEKLLLGKDYTVNTFLHRGELAFALITEKHIVPGPRFLIGGHVAPADLDPVVEKALLADAHALCLAMGLTDGPANFDVIVADDGTRYVLEVGARMSGNGFPRLAHAVAGVDCVQALVSLAIGEPVELASDRSEVARLQVLTSPLEVEGELQSVGDLTAVRALPGVSDADVFATPGDVVLPFTEAGRKLGWLVVHAPTRAELDEVLATATTALNLVVTPATVLA
ncbi:ATP-grasp domain-containing protein [Actinokineospora globicatena]|uniref:ATP-grasp domain-containing protein n=1 Tax=Actinokineospora globicatena TaxID=103729 RepID=UPI0020A27B0F|nr:ATP-grasp domain-containing protein [Actinokineospora globicatena]MCP2306905.1 Biotin carboxylase [Actinokineospora globicatena]GLW82348.1 carbamoyl phosphate synthase [Actinokineospora globicatena]GLW89059.1 carbamoyl phosphate synthase [Actinokineospora globicatena]